MFTRILVAYDGSPGAQAALGLGIALARSLDGDLSSISIEEHLPRYAATISEVDEAKEQIDAHFRALTKQAHDTAALEGVELETFVRQGHEVKEILEFAHQEKIDLLILGWHGHSRIFDRIIGSTSLSLARLAPCSVLVVRPAAGAPHDLDQIKRILVGLDGSPLGRLAFRRALDLATLCGATLVGVTVREGSPLATEVRPESPYIQQLKTAAEEHARAAGVAFEHMVRGGHAGEALRAQARETNADLIVLGATGLEHPWSLTIGGTASNVVGEAPCSVLLVRSPQAALHVRDIMVRTVASVVIDAPLAEVVDLLLRRSVKALPVLDARRHVVGIITGGDLLSRGDMSLRLSVKRELDADALREQLRALRRSATLARDVMTRHVHTVDADAALATVIRLMAAHRVKRLPVVNREKELVGIVSRADVLRAIAALPTTAKHVERELPAIARTVADAAATEVPVVAADATADEVLANVLESPLRRVVVVGPDGRVLGLISDRDLLARSSPDTRPWIVRKLQGPRPGERPGVATTTPFGPGHPLMARDLMAPSLFTVRPDDSLTDAIRLMMQHGVKRLIVVDDDHRFRGLVDRREILRLLSGTPG